MNNEIKSTAPKPFIFVLMPFDEKFNDAYKFGIKGAAEDVGAYAERVDEQIFTEGILDRIFNQISKADVIVADMTGRNPNVFYEVGYAHALGKIVLLLTQNAEDIPFDLKHRPHIVYGGKIETLRNKLTERLIWAIDKSKKPEIKDAYEQKKVVTPDDIELCLKTISGDTKEVVLEGLRELEIYLNWNSKISDDPRIIDVFEALLKHSEAEIRIRALDVLNRMISLAENNESRKKLLAYSLHIVSIAKSDSNNEARSKAIQVLLGVIGDERVVEPIIDVVLNGSEDIYDRIKSIFIQRGIKGEIKRQLKSELLNELKNSKNSEKIKSRIRYYLEQVRWM
ncbi:MAG: hypothetical protein O8C64_14075 [Candidatus Methanoperedens sp.]|nr:hypothetical protein [Candidatus Methanoperedens sp.]MCZ7404047.1 hypothetical protein [Candidatus Methanoperedens sp.]